MVYFSAIILLSIMKEKLTGTALPDLDLHLFNVKSDDALTNKLLMLIEGVYGLGVKHSIKKYNYTEQRYYQLLKEFKNLGSDALIEQKRGPKNNSRRSEKIIQQIIQHKFLDPNASAADIAQKLSKACLLYTSPSPRDRTRSRMPSSA